MLLLCFERARRSWFGIHTASETSTAETHTDGGAVIRKPGSAWLQGTPAISIIFMFCVMIVVLKWTFAMGYVCENSQRLEFHRESSLYLPCRFSQLSTEIPGDVLFRRMDPPKLLNLIRKSKKFTDLRRRIPVQSTSKLSSMACVSTVSGGVSRAAALSQWEKRAQGHFFQGQIEVWPLSCRSACPCRCTRALGSPSQIEGPLLVTGPICIVFGGTACDARKNVAGLFCASRASISVYDSS